jgi:hypothetical protein
MAQHRFALPQPQPDQDATMTLEHEIAIVTAAASDAWLCAAGGRALSLEHHAFGAPLLAHFGT